MSELPQQQQQRNRDILPNGEPDHQRDGLLFNQSIERKREKNKIAARIKRSRKKQRLEALELRERELSERRRQLENELRMSRLANRNIQLCSSSNANDNVGAADGDGDDDAAAATSVEARTEALQTLCNEVRAVCVQAQGAIDALTDMRRELSALFEDLE
ncbi:hypothetical protein GGI17_001706 [Coemansia sp. S146]|nr:hypothetical protein GGI17_001706 [Coemansia sp. S146]